MQQREYVKAHDAYIKCAIGSAPWPMGITGTAARSKRKGALVVARYLATVSSPAPHTASEGVGRLSSTRSDLSEKP